MSISFLINTGLQPGVRAAGELKNRLNGFFPFRTSNTRLKPGVNETKALLDFADSKNI